MYELKQAWTSARATNRKREMHFSNAEVNLKVYSGLA